MWPSPMVAYRKDIAAALNSPEIAPDYDVWAIVDERPYTRVLILKKHDQRAADESLEQFPRTWGTSSQIVGRDFKGALVVDQRAAWEGDAHAPPQLLYAYRDYNIVRVGRAYVGAAQDLGPTDINAVLIGTSSRPPLQKFILARDPARLKAAIDACLKGA